MSDLANARQELQALCHDKRWNEMESPARSILRRCPTDIVALNALALAVSDRGDDIEAIRIHRQALAYNPHCVTAYQGLATLLSHLNRVAEAADVFKQWLSIDPDNPQVQYMLAATAGGAVPPGCSRKYVEAHFNRFADTFDNVLIQQLHYQGPELVSELMADFRREARAFSDVLDAGCGTGLCGPSLRPYCQVLWGVDIAGEMVEQARKRGCYDKLCVGDLCDFMEGSRSTFDLVVASDVFVYFGELQRAMRAASHALRNDGLLVVAVEALTSCHPAAFVLRPTGRYAHGESYLRSVLEGAGFRIEGIREEPLRWERGKKVPFYMAIGRKLNDKGIS